MINENLKQDAILYYELCGFFNKRKMENRLNCFEENWKQFCTDREELSTTYYMQDKIFEMLESEFEKRQQSKKAKKANALKKQAEKKHADGFHSLANFTKPHEHEGGFVVTCAQNNTHVDRDFFDSLVNFCELNDTQLLVAKITYDKNRFLQPDHDEASDLWYDPVLKPYLIDADIVELKEKFQILANANVIPTAKNPVNGFESATPHNIHAIIPSVKIALKSVPRPKTDSPKFLLGTGSITQRNYILRKAGAVASYEHSIGALYIDEHGKFYQLEKMPRHSGFYHKHYYYTAKDAEYVPDAIAAFQPGDLHSEKMLERYLISLLNYLKEYNPLHILGHDLIDFESRNHHNIKDCVFLAEHHAKNSSVENDLKKTMEVLESISETCPNATLHVIESNHDNAIDTWLKNTDFKADPQNARTYLKLMLAIHEHIAECGNADNFNTLEYALYDVCYSNDQIFDLPADFHRVDESLQIANVEHGMHGHLGINGARGNPESFRKFGVAINTGHTHTPNISGKVYTAGVSAGLEMGYNKGASSWAIAHIVTYKNGQRQIIIDD